MLITKKGTNSPLSLAAALEGRPWAGTFRRLARKVKLPSVEQFTIACFFSVTVVFFLLVLCSLSLRTGRRAVLLSGSGTGIRWGFVVSGGEGAAKNSGECDWFQGEWVLDDDYPLYESKDCPFMDFGFRCSENGRPDRFYTKWRWQPAGCNLPRFDSEKLLEKLRNRRLVFVGDSIGRNQWESLLCMLSSAVSNKSSIFEVNGSPITKHNGFLVFKFRDYNCTVEYYRSPFLVVQGRAPKGSPKRVKMTLRLDVMDWISTQWRDADVLIFNTGHWWNYEKTIRAGCYFQEGNDVKMNVSIEDAYYRSIATVLNWINKEVNKDRTQVFFRTYAPVHFRGGDWRTGGSCHLEQFPDMSLSPLSSKQWEIFLKPFENLTANLMTDSTGIGLQLLNVTQMTARRKDGHLSLYYLGPSNPAPLHKQDCSHWCLPGVPDTWNEILYAELLINDSATATIHQVKLS